MFGGPAAILSMEKTAIGADEHAPSLSNRLSKMGAALLLRTLGGEMRETPQDQLFAAIAGYKFANRTPRGKSAVDRAKLHFPLFGDVIRKTAISRFSRTLGTLVTSGVPILQALNITRETAGNMVIARAIGQVHESVKEGESIVQPLEASGAFPPMVVSMIDVGEETGQLPEMLLKIADVYDDEVDNSVAAMTAALEPIMIVFLALVVGTIVIALFLPLISIIQGLQQQT